MTESMHVQERPMAVARDFIAGALQALVVAPLRTGTFALSRHDGSTAAFAIVVGALYAMALMAIVFGEAIRATTELVTSQDATGRTVVPVPLIPAVLLLVGVAIALLLAGAQRCRWWLRILALASTTLVLGALVVDAAARDRGLALVIAILGLSGTVIACAWSWVASPPLAVHALVLVATVQACIIASYRCLVAGTEGIDLPYEVVETSAILGIFILLVTPLAFLGGLKTVAFGVSLCTWSSAFARTRLSLRSARVLMVFALVCAVVVAAWSASAMRWQQAAPGAWLVRSYLLPVVLIAIAVGCWILVQRIPPRPGAVLQAPASTPDGARDEDPVDGSGRVPEAIVDDAARTLALPTSLAFLASALIGVPLLLMRRLLVDIFPSNPFLDGLVIAVRGEGVLTATRLLACIGVAAACIWLARSGRSLMAGIAAISAVMLTAFVVIQPGGLLSGWPVSVDAMGDIGILLAIGLAIGSAVHRRLSMGQVQIILLIALLSMLVRQADFFTVPFSVIAGIAGSAFLIFGLVWGFLTDGGSAHRDSVGYPRNARMLIFLGQALFGISIVAWATIGRRSLDSQTLADFASISVQTLGTALIIATICYAWQVVARGGFAQDETEDPRRLNAVNR